MKRRFLFIAALVAFAGFAAVPFLDASPREERHGELLFWKLTRAREALGLTDQQVEELRSIAMQLREQNAPYRDQLRGGFLAIAATLLANPNDLSTAESLLEQQADAERAVKQNALVAASKALNVLTPEQRAKVAAFLRERKGRHP
ncbi:MAG TPA: periplasmic heavy metal sensor [Thermoanaerobaculia bacterium]|nr:periplasmic heavy metal sensor [Thermoanaerobaculia bacterium]